LVKKILGIWPVGIRVLLVYTLSFGQQTPGNHSGKETQALVDINVLTAIWGRIGLDFLIAHLIL
jgi:hypothetical protein